MIFIWLLLAVSTLLITGRRADLDPTTESSSMTSFDFSMSKKLHEGIDEALFDRDWDRCLNELHRLKPHERLELLKLYDPYNVEVGRVRNSSLRANNATYRTVSGRSILYIKISETDTGGRDHGWDERPAETTRLIIARPVIVIVAGIDGSDWIAVHVIMHLLTNLVTSYDVPKLSGFDWWIIPLLNPDGFITSMAYRNYRPNVNPTTGCSGVNLDRNFLLQRGRCGKKQFDCEEYPGKKPFSEIESRALRDFIKSGLENCKVFIALKEGAKALVYPFASTNSSPPGPYTTLQNLLCAEALQVFDECQDGKSKIFRFGNSGSVFGPSSGFVEDWAKRHMGIPRSFAFYIADCDDRSETPKRFDEYAIGALKAIKVLAASRRIEPCAESFDELIANGTRNRDLSKLHKSRPVPWNRELIHENLREKINRGVSLEMPVEFARNAASSVYDRFDFDNEK